MKVPTWKRFGWLLSLLGVVCLATVSFAQAEQPKQADSKTVRFTKKCLAISPNEGCDVGDVNQDGVLDIVAGPNWFAGPDYIPRPLRDVGEFANVYYHNNGEFLLDVNGDGRLDVVSGDWMDPEVYWYENPGKVGLEKGVKWKQHLLSKGRGQNEIYDLHDFDGDGVPELFVSCWDKEAPQVVWKFAKTAAGEPTLERIELGPKGGHGFGFGDINGDGREDIITEAGWYERPEGDPLTQPWKLREETALPHPSCPILVLDVNRDGRNDLIWGKAHGYGLHWWEQGPPKADGSTTWHEHLIDDSWSQPHTMVWADIDGDGAAELITGKRVRGHCGGDPGGKEPAVLFYYEWDQKAGKFHRHTIAGEGENIGTGMQIRVVDLNADGRLDIAVPGKSGTYVLINEGVEEGK